MWLLLTPLLSPQSGVQQNRQHTPWVAVLHQGLQARIGLLLKKCICVWLCDPQQQSSACPLHVDIHFLLQVSVKAVECIYDGTGHSGTQVVYLRERRDSANHPSVLLNTWTKKIRANKAVTSSIKATHTSRSFTLSVLGWCCERAWINFSPFTLSNLCEDEKIKLNYYSAL